MQTTKAAIANSVTEYSLVGGHLNHKRMNAASITHNNGLMDRGNRFSSIQPPSQNNLNLSNFPTHRMGPESSPTSFRQMMEPF